MDRTSAGSFRVVGRGMSPKRTWTGSRDVGGLWIPQIPSVTNAIEISDMRKGTGGWVKKATGK